MNYETQRANARRVPEYLNESLDEAAAFFVSTSSSSSLQEGAWK